MQVLPAERGKFMPEPVGHLWPLSTSVQTASAQTSFSAFSIVLLIVLILINAFFAASEIAIITLNDNKVRKWRRMATNAPNVSSSSPRIPAGFWPPFRSASRWRAFDLSSGFPDVCRKLADAFAFLPIPYDVLFGISTVLVTLFLSYFSLVFGELVPKKIAMQRAEVLSFKFAGILNGISSFFHRSFPF